MRFALQAALYLSLLALCSQVTVKAQGVPFRGVRDNARFIVFLHTGATPRQLLSDKNRLMEQLVTALQARGFTVGRGDDNQDPTGPGVDYFREEDRFGAADVADIVNGTLMPYKLKQLEPNSVAVTRTASAKTSSLSVLSTSPTTSPEIVSLIK